MELTQLLEFILVNLQKKKVELTTKRAEAREVINTLEAESANSMYTNGAIIQNQTMWKYYVLIVYK